MNAYLHYYYYARPFFYVPTPQGRAPTNITCFYLKSRWIFAAFSIWYYDCRSGFSDLRPSIGSNL